MNQVVKDSGNTFVSAVYIAGDNSTMFTYKFHQKLDAYQYASETDLKLQEMNVDKDDQPIGQILNRRDALKLLV